MGLNIVGMEVVEIRRKPSGGRVVTVRLPEQREERSLERRERSERREQPEQRREDPKRDFRVDRRDKDEIPAGTSARPEGSNREERLAIIERVSEETGFIPSRDLTESMLRWQDFSEARVRQWCHDRLAEMAKVVNAKTPAAAVKATPTPKPEKARPERAEPVWANGEPEEIRRESIIRKVSKELGVQPSPAERREMFYDPDFSETFVRDFMTKVKTEQQARMCQLRPDEHPETPAKNGPKKGWAKPAKVATPAVAEPTTEEQLIQAAFGTADEPAIEPIALGPGEEPVQISPTGDVSAVSEPLPPPMPDNGGEAEADHREEGEGPTRTNGNGRSLLLRDVFKKGGPLDEEALVALETAGITDCNQLIECGGELEAVLPNYSSERIAEILKQAKARCRKAAEEREAD